MLISSADQVIGVELEKRMVFIWMNQIKKYMVKQVVIRMRNGEEYIYEGEKIERTKDIIYLVNRDDRHEIYIDKDILSIEFYDV